MSTPPRIRPIAAPPPEIAPKTPNARARSLGSVNVTVISDSAAGASSGGEDALQGAGREQQPGARGDAAERGGDREAAEADDEHPLAADEVGDAAAEQQQAAEGQRVRGDDPLAVGVADAEVVLRGRQRDVHDRRVEDDHQLGDGDDAQRQPAARVGLGSGAAAPSRRTSDRS